MRQDRIDLYKQLEEARKSKLLVYITSTRGNLETQIANDILPKFTEHLDKIGDTKKITLYYIQMAVIRWQHGVWSI